MEAGACSCDYDGDMPAVYERKIIMARKAHRCCECGEQIQLGQQYERASGLWCGKWDHYNTCLICRNIREDYAPCGYHEHLWEDIEECLGVSLLGDDWEEE